MALPPETEIRITALQLANQRAHQLHSAEQVVDAAKVFETYLNEAKQPQEFG